MALTGLWISAVAVAPAGAVPITVTQERTFNFVSGWTSPLTGNFTSTGWTLNPFPFTQLSQITRIVLTFDSTDPAYVSGIGPGGGNLWVALGVLNDSFQKVDIASVSHANPSVTLTASSGQFFTTVRALLLDGAMGVTMGGYEYAPGWLGVRNYTLSATSTFRIQVSGDAPPPPPPVPEPATLLLVGAGLLGVTCRLRRAGRAR